MDLGEALYLVTPAALLTALVTGVLLGAVFHHVRRSSPTAFLWGGLVIAALWYLPLMTQRLLEDGLYVNGVRTVGTGSLFILFISVGTLTIVALRRWNER